jgi:sugar lactone lactonase YvrE
VDRQGHVYVHHTVHATSASDDTVVVFDGKGRFVRSWGREFKGGAHGLHIQREGKQEFLYLCDTQRAVVVKMTLKGEEVFTLGYPKESPEYRLDGEGKPAVKYSPTNLAIGPNGDIYVGDGYGSSFINQYDAKGNFIRTFGGKGKEAGRLNQPHGIALDRRGKEPVLLVADRGNRRFQYFSLDGKHLRFSAEGDVKMPCHFDQRKGLLLTPDLEARVTLMDAGDRVLAQLGEDSSGTWGQMRRKARAEFVAGKFVCPHSACFDGDGNIFVVEWVEVGRVTKLRKIS